MSDDYKRAAAERALDFVDDGMTLGLGTGSTAAWFVRLLGERVSDGLEVKGIPTSEATRRLAEEVGIDLIDLDHAERVDLTVDGADEIDRDLCLIKGGGGALLREKLVACASDRMIVIADDAKLVGTLGQFPLPVEVIPFGFSVTAERILAAVQRHGCPGTEVVIREGEGGKAFLTDEGHYILDCRLQRIERPGDLARALDAIVGVVEHGLFPGIADTAILGAADGVDVLHATEKTPHGRTSGGKMA